MNTHAHYNTRAPYEKISRSRALAIQKLLPTKDSLVVLDVGCGAGGLAQLLKEKYPGISLYGLDVSAAAVEKAKSVMKGAWVFDAEHDPLPREISTLSIDAVVVSEVLEHLFEPEKLLRMLKNSSLTRVPIIITVPNVLFWKNRLRILFGRFEYTDEGLMDRGHVHFFSWRALQKLVSSEGYRITGIHHVVPTRATRPFAGWFPGLFAYQFAIRIESV